MTQNAKVIECIDGFAIVKIIRQSACEKCSAHRFCEGGKCVDVKVKNGIGAKVDDFVVISSSDTKVLSYAALVFLLPVLLALSLYLLLSPAGEIFAAIFSIIGFTLPIVVAMILNSKFKDRLYAKITAINDVGDTDNINNLSIQ